MALSWEDARERAAQEAPIAGWSGGSLKDKYVVPPFSVLNTASGDWQDRKRFWLAMGIQSEIGRGDKLTYRDPTMGGLYTPLKGRAEAEAAAATLAPTLGGDVVVDTSRRAADQRSNLTDAPGLPEWASSMGVENMAPGTSIFDPVLCELVYRWWAPDGGVVLDPFAGGSVRGIVAGYMGHPYVGIDLAADQIAANRAQAESILRASGKPAPRWEVGDSLLTLPTLDVRADLVFTCPPYYDLEVYSDDPADISNMPWPRFLETYRRIIGEACDKLAPDRFAVIVVGEVRDKRQPDGAYVGLVPETIRAFTDAGMKYYNEVILVNAAGSLPVRAGKQFEATRKIGKQHQNVLVFVKGRVSRGWSVDRTPPPSPQLSAEDLLDEPVSTAAIAPHPIAAAAAAAGECPCPMRDCVDHDHGYTANQAAWGCDPHDHPSTDSVDPATFSDPLDDLVAVAEIDADTEAIAAVPVAPAVGGIIDPADGWRRYDEGRALHAASGEIAEADPATLATLPAVDPPPPPKRKRSRAEVVPAGLAVGDLADAEGWACTSCGGPPDGPLRTTIQTEIRRGACPTCDRDKPFMRGL